MSAAKPHFDFLIVGAGFSGLTMAERITTQLGKTCLLVEKRNHIGGNAHDRINDHGVLIHPYGPHYFRTNSQRIVDYLSQFTKWHPVDYEIRVSDGGVLWQFPINLNTFEQFLGRTSTTDEMEKWLAENRTPIANPANSEEVILSQVGRALYEKFFEGYTLKQWNRHPRDLDASVCGRIPIRTNRDNRYLQENFQALPADGYESLFRNMIAACGDLLTLELETDFRKSATAIRYDHLIYTGPVDSFFEHCHGPLPYRSLRFEPESFTATQLKERSEISGKQGFWQSAMQINYPNEESFTRIVEIKHATRQDCPQTTIVREYPDAFEPGKEPYYPIPAPDTQAIYAKYRELAATQANTTFLGRLATYRYYNMDQVTGMALTKFDHIAAKY